MPITVYTKPACVQCNAAFRALDKAGFPYQVVDVSTDIKALGYMQAPVVAANTGHWSGFRPDRINILLSAPASNV